MNIILLIFCYSFLIMSALGIDLSSCPVKFITDTLRTNDGKIWVVGENALPVYLDENYSNEGWHTPSAGKNFPDTLNFYAVEEDLQGRIWIGTDHCGVAVYNGESWRTYGIKEALPGERVFSIAVSKTNGDIAIATSGGLAVYSPARDSWQTFTRANGLPEDQLYSVIFDHQGNLWAGSSCSGVAWSTPEEGYQNWKCVRTSWYWDKEQRIPQPRERAGDGLPSNLINILEASPDGGLWAGTTSGLGYKTGTSNWRFCRGKDFSAKNKGLYQIRHNTPATDSRYPDILLNEDFITALKVINDKLLIGFRQKGACLLDIKKPQIIKTYDISKSSAKCKWINSFVQTHEGELWGGTFGGGMIRLDGDSELLPLLSLNNNCQLKENISFPNCIPSLSEHLLKNHYDSIKILSANPRKEKVIFYDEDWNTQGDWCYRYGRDYALLCAANAPTDNVVYFTSMINSLKYDCAGTIGPNNTRDDLRHWVETINDFNNRNVLVSPDYCIRTEAEWDDHGEVYPASFDGPDVWIMIKVPKGKQLLSIYFYNPNGHKNENTARRDYLVEIREMKLSLPSDVLFQNDMQNFDRKDLMKHASEHISLPVLARTRVNYFAGSGVYKSFLVQGPNSYYVRVRRNCSFNTIVNGIFLTNLSFEDRVKFKLRGELLCFQDIRYPEIENFRGNPTPFLSRGDGSLIKNPLVSSSYRTYLINLLRSANTQKVATNDQLKWCLHLWNSHDKSTFDQFLIDVWNRHKELHPYYRSAEWSKYSPETIPFSVKEVEMMEQMNIDWQEYLPGRTPKIPEKEIKKILLEKIKT